MHPYRKIGFMVAAALAICAWSLLEAHFNDLGEEHVMVSDGLEQWRPERTGVEVKLKTTEQGIARGGTKDKSSSTSILHQHTSTSMQDAAILTPGPSLPDRVVVMARTPKDDIRWVHQELQDWQSVIYDIDIDTPHKQSTLDPLIDNNLRTLRNKGNEANAYLAYIVQHYNNLPSTMAFIHPHKNGYPAAWHTDNNEYSNVVSIRTLNMKFVQSNGYANLRCVNDPGCPHEVMPFRDPAESHRVAEIAMPEAWQALFNNTDIPEILATPCCAQFAVSSKQVRKRSLDEYKKYYTWLMETPLSDATSGRVFEYLWHVVYGQEPV